jgi:hypothetical protein
MPKGAWVRESVETMARQSGEKGSKALTTRDFRSVPGHSLVRIVLGIVFWEKGALNRCLVPLRDERGEDRLPILIGGLVSFRHEVFSKLVKAVEERLPRARLLWRQDDRLPDLRYKNFVTFQMDASR